MTTSTVKLYLYILVHIIAPIICLLGSIAWGSFFTSKSFLENLSDNLSVLAIWYIGISIVWACSIKYIDKQAEKISREIESKRRKTS